MKRLLLALTVLLVYTCVESKKTTTKPKSKKNTNKINIALLTRYNQTQPYREVVAFAVKYINKNQKILPNHKLLISYEFYDSNPSSVVKSACNVIKSGVSGIITDGGSSIVAMQADTLAPYNIPLYSLVATDPFLASNQRPFLIRALPSDSYQSTAVFHLLKYHDWKQFSILTSSNTYGMNGMLELQRLATKELIGIDTIQHFPIPNNSSALDVRYELGVIKKSLTQIIVLHCDGKYARTILEQANELTMMTEGYVWVVTDAVTSNPSVLGSADGSGYIQSYFNGLIGTRPLYSSGPFYQKFKKNFTEEYPQIKIGDAYARSAFDAILVLSNMLHNYLEDGNTLKEQNIDCMSTDFSTAETAALQWQNGNEILGYLKEVDIQGVANKLKFAKDNGPLDVQYDIVNFREDIFLKVGRWDKINELQMKNDIVFFEENTTVPSQRSNILSGFHLRFGVAEEKPFLYENKVNCTGNACFTGYCVELVEKLAEELNFTYTFRTSPDGKFGGLEDDGTWNGNIKALLDGDIDLITVDLSVNSERSKVIDFTRSFKSASINAVLKTDHASHNRKFFLSPFSTEVWYCILIANVICTLLLTFVSKVSPYGFYGGKMYALLACRCSNCVANRKLTAAGFKPLARESHFQCLLEELECENENTLDRISLYNSFWMISTGLFGQSAEQNPYCAPGRFVIMGWWFFMMIMSAMYTANLAAALTVKNINVGFKEIEGLLEQDKLEWGTVRSTHPELLLNNSINPKYRSLIKEGKHVDSVAEGLARVRAGGYVLIYEKPVLDFETIKDCDLKSVGGDFQAFEYAFGIAKLSPYTSTINQKILAYKESGYLDDLWLRWRGPRGHNCPGQTADTVTLGMNSLSGIFIALGAALVVGIILLFVEMLHASCLDVYGNKHRLGDDGRRDVNAPFQGRFFTALYIRFKLIANDLVNYWFSFETLKTLTGVEKAAAPTKKISFDAEAFVAKGQSLTALGHGGTAEGRWNVVRTSVETAIGSPISGYH